jgi:LAO/AO transport system kinase
MAYQINASWKKKIATGKLYDTNTLIDGILQRNNTLLAQSITCIESKKEVDKKIANAILNACLPYSGNAKKIGITGAPGVGKSTFIETLGTMLIKSGYRIAVLAIDPSSQTSYGSILGDKTRMAQLSVHPNSFVRPSAAGDTLGGVARKTREAIVLCEAAGFDIIFVETVGVGQSEIAVHSMVDCFLLLLLPGAGDDLQGIKRGIVEMADFVCIHKADGERVASAKEAKQSYQNALHYFPPKSSGWQPKVTLCSSMQDDSIAAVWGTIENYFEFVTRNGFLVQNRQQQALYWLEQTIEQALKAKFFQHPAVIERWSNTKNAVMQGEISPFEAAAHLLELALPSSTD